MINGFSETDPLSDYELTTILPQIVRGLLRKVGKANAITNSTSALSRTMVQYACSDKVCLRLTSCRATVSCGDTISFGTRDVRRDF